MLQGISAYKFFIFCLLLLFQASAALSQGVSLKIAGSTSTGFHVAIYYGAKLVVTNTEEFSLELFNNDLSTEAHIQFTGQKWTGNSKGISLQRDLYVKEFDANLTVTITYTVINEAVVKKSIQLFQPSMPGMLYIINQTARPAEKPNRYVTFEYDSFPGGLIHEMFPAAGFVTPDDNVVGFLTDAGYKKQYTRNTRRRFSGREEGL